MCWGVGRDGESIGIGRRMVERVRGMREEWVEKSIRKEYEKRVLKGKGTESWWMVCVAW